MSLDNNIDYIIKSTKKILIISHINPDGDTLGSMSGLYSLIRENYKKDADMLLDNLPATYEFLPAIKNAKFYNTIDKSLVYDLVITVDVAAIDRMDEVKVFFEKAHSTLNIDHHATNNSYAQNNIVVPEASSTGEVIASLAQENGWKMNYDAALSLYTAILTDTGSFKFSNTSPKTLETAAKLLEYGVKPHDVYKWCYESYPKNFFLFQNYCLNKAVFLKNDRVVYTEIYKKDVEKFAVGPDCTEGLTEKLRAISSTEIAFIAKEIAPGMTKFSMRSKNVDVSAICAMFGGGGHKLAAGCVVKSSVKTAVDKVLAQIENLEL